MEIKEAVELPLTHLDLLSRTLENGKGDGRVAVLLLLDLLRERKRPRSEWPLARIFGSFSFYAVGDAARYILQSLLLIYEQ